MKIGNLFKAIIKTVTLPVNIGADILTMGVNKFTNERKFFTEKKIDDIAELLNE